MPFNFGQKLGGGKMIAKKVFGKSAKDSQAMKIIMEDKDVAAAFDKPQERREFFEKVLEQTGGTRSVEKNDIRKALGYFHQGKGKHISKSESQKVAGKFFGPHESRYIFVKGVKERLKASQKELHADRSRPVMDPAHQNPSSTGKAGNMPSSPTGPSRPRFF